MGRPAIYGEPMTAAQRKARSVAFQRGEIMDLLMLAQREAADWRQCMQRGRPGATDADIEAGFAQVAIMIQDAITLLHRGDKR